jgi:phosphoglucosamine mutase
MGDQPNGKNINENCGSMHPEKLFTKVREYRADIGLAHDGDADRVLLCDENGDLIDGDDVMAIAALNMMEQGTLNEETLITTVMSNEALIEVIQNAGGRVVRTDVGDKNVIDEMLKNGFNLGGEQSGHLIFRDHSTTGDGLVAALQILKIMKETGKKLSTLASCWTPFPQVLTNVIVKQKPPFEELDDVLDLVAQAKAAIKDEGGRVLLRYSGTEPKVRLLMEGRNAETLQHWSEKICASIKAQVGA